MCAVYSHCSHIAPAAAPPHTTARPSRAASRSGRGDARSMALCLRLHGGPPRRWAPSGEAGAAAPAMPCLSLGEAAPSPSLGSSRASGGPWAAALELGIAPVAGRSEREKAECPLDLAALISLEQCCYICYRRRELQYYFLFCNIIFFAPGLSTQMERITIATIAKANTFLYWTILGQKKLIGYWHIGIILCTRQNHENNMKFGIEYII